MVKGKIKRKSKRKIKRKVKKRPPRLFTKKGKLYVRIGGKKYLIKDQERYTKKEILDTILEDVLIKRKKSRAGKVTKKERKRNRRNMANFRKIEKLNNNNSKSFKLPSGFTKKAKDDAQFKNLLDALAKILNPDKEDINLKTRKEIKEAEVERKKKAEAKAKSLVPFKPKAPSSSSIPISSIPVGLPIFPSSAFPKPAGKPPSSTLPTSSSSTLPPPTRLDLDTYRDVKKAVRDEMKKPGKRNFTRILKEIIDENKSLASIDTSNPTGVGVAKTEIIFDRIVKIFEDRNEEIKLASIFNDKFGSIEDMERIRKGTPSLPTKSKAPPPPPPSSSSKKPPPPPPPGPPGPGGPPPPGPPGPPSKKVVDKPLELFKFKTDESKLAGNDKLRYDSSKKEIISKFSKSKLVAKRKLLQKLIQDEKLPIDKDYPRKKEGKKMIYTGMKTAEELSQEIIDYYEKQNKRVEIPTVINKYFPKGIDNLEIVSTPAKKPKPATTPTPTTSTVDVIEELKKRQAKDKSRTTKGETIEEKLAREKKEKEKEEGAEFLKGIKLKPLPKPKEKPEPKPVEEKGEEKKGDDLGPPPLEEEPGEEEEEEEEVERAIEALSTIEQDADGAYYTGDGLSTSEIDGFMNSMGMNNYIGTYPADFLKYLPANLPKEFGFIMNLDKSSKPGSHWIAVYIDTLHNNSIEYYDSFGREPTKDFMKQIKKLIDRIEPNTYLKMKINRIQDQNVNSSNCGFFCMRWILDKATGRNFKESTRFNPNGEEEISLWKNKMFSYI